MCPILLQRLSFLSGNPVWSRESQQDVYVSQFVDPLTGSIAVLPPEGVQRTARLLLFTDTTYIVLCPGEKDKLALIAQTAGAAWKNTPFVADTQDLSLTMNLVTDEFMRLDEGQAIPAILEYDGRNHIVDFGRRFTYFLLSLIISPGRYGDTQLLQLLIRQRAQIEADSQHTVSHAKLLLEKTAAIYTRLSNSPHGQRMPLPYEILEQIISYLPPEDIDMHRAKASISWYLATLASTRKHLRRAIQETEDLLCVCNGQTAVLDHDSGQYPPGTEIRWIPIKHIERQRREVMNWYYILCRIVGFKL